jgi:putative thioredoxin
MNETTPATAETPWVISTRVETFDTDVIQRSRETLIVLDFWAPWCAPCRALGPILEELARECAGRFVLVKANTDELPQIAAGFQVQGIPAVYALSDGEVLDAFSGALPKAHVRAWLEKALGVRELVVAQRAEKSSPVEAESQYRRLLDAQPQHRAAKIGLARTLLAQGRVAECRTVIEELQERGFLEPDAEKIKVTLELGEKSGHDLAERRAALQADPGNLELQLQLAEALVGARQYEDALRTCLALVEQDRQGVGEQARCLMIDIFRVLPDDSDLTATYRRKLSMALF